MKKNFSTAAEGPVVRKRFHEDNVAGIKQQILILPELRELIPPLTGEELEQLENNLIREGCRENLLVWQTVPEALGQTGTEPVYVLIDGHNRYGICQRHNLPFNISLKDFAGLEAVKDFMIDNQLGRRNLSPEQVSYLRGKKYLSLRKGHGGNRKSGSMPPPDSATGPDSGEEAQKTAELLAKQYGVSGRTIRNDAAYAEGMDKLPQPLRQDILARKVKVPRRNILALPEPPEQGNPVLEADALEQLVKPKAFKSSGVRKAGVSGERSRNGITGPAPEPAAVSRLVQQVHELAAALDPASPDLLARCRELIHQTQQVIDQLQG